MYLEPIVADLAKLLSHPARVSIVMALMSGREMTATNLALEADITAQTASSHLDKLVRGKVLSVRKSGQYRYFRISGRDIAELIEILQGLSARQGHPTEDSDNRYLALKKARVCYDHLAGELAVDMLDQFKAQQLLEDRNGVLELTAAGITLFRKKGYNPDAEDDTQQLACKNCLDWSEQRFHLAGSLGRWIMTDMLQRRWAEKLPDSRIVRITERGLKKLEKEYSIRLSPQPSEASESGA